MTLHVALGDGFFGTQRACEHVALSVVTGCMVFAIYIPNINLITMNNMSLLYIFHIAFPVTFLSFRYFLYKPDCNNPNGNV